MRDIRSDLKERIQEISKERQKLEQELADLDQREKMVLMLLRDEEMRLQKQSGSQERRNLFVHAFWGSGEEQPELTQFLVSLMSDGNAWSLDQLKEAGEKRGVLKGYDVPGRSIHGALVNLLKKGHAERLPDKTWRLVVKKSGASEKNDAPPEISDEAS